MGLLTFIRGLFSPPMDAARDHRAEAAPSAPPPVSRPQGSRAPTQPPVDQSQEDHFAAALRSLLPASGGTASALLAAEGLLREAVSSGDPRQVDQALRPLLPAEIWTWPEYEAWASHINERPTRLRMVQEFAHTLLRKTASLERLQQLKENLDRRPIWQLRAVGDGRDWQDCPGSSRVTQHGSDGFWLRNGPHVCSRVGCRCAIRAYTEDEASRLSLAD